MSLHTARESSYWKRREVGSVTSGRMATSDPQQISAAMVVTTPASCRVRGLLVSLSHSVEPFRRSRFLPMQIAELSAKQPQEISTNDLPRAKSRSPDSDESPRENDDRSMPRARAAVMNTEREAVQVPVESRERRSWIALPARNTVEQAR